MKIPDRDYLDSHLKTLMNKREEVFRPFHNMPTMTLEEFADKEIQQIEVKEREKQSEVELQHYVEQQRNGFTAEQYMDEKECVEEKDRQEKIDWDA